MDNHIRRLRQARGWSQAELGDRIEPAAHFTTIAKLESNTRGLTTKWIEKLAKALGVSEGEVTGSAPAGRKVPLIGQIAAGAWREAIHDPDGWVYAPPGGPNVFALRPDGDSLNKIIMDGAYVLVDPDIVELVEGKLYAVRNEGGEATLKIYRTSPPRLEPCSTNPIHQPIVFGKEPFTLIGRVVWQGMEM